MNARRLKLIAIVVIGIIGLTQLSAKLFPAQLNEVMPASITIPIEVVAAPSKSASELIAFWQGRFERDPRDYISLTHLAGVYISQARATGDAGIYTKAEQVLQKAQELNPDYLPASAYLATVRFAQHDFAAALKLSQTVYANDRRALNALATVGDAQLELGQYTEAVRTYEELSERNQSAAVLSRLARLAWLHGQPEAAITYMEEAVEEAAASELSGERAAWYSFQLGDLYFKTGQLTEAQIYYEMALTQFEGYYLALSGLGKVVAAEGDIEGAIGYYEQVVAIIPQPDFLAALGEYYAIQGDDKAAQAQYDTVAFIAELEATNGIIYNRQLALYYADHDLNLVQAAAIAAGELTLRQDVYGFDAAAWALYKNGQYETALIASQQALRLGTREAAFYVHAGKIYQALGEFDKAEEMFNTAQTINPYFVSSRDFKARYQVTK